MIAALFCRQVIFYGAVICRLTFCQVILNEQLSPALNCRQGMLNDAVICSQWENKPSLVENEFLFWSSWFPFNWHNMK